MNIKDDIIVLYIKTKNKVRKIVSYKSDDCELRIYHQKIADFIATFLIRYFLKHMSRDDQFLTMLMPIYTTIILS